MIRSLLSHFFVPDEDPEALKIIAADWLVALRDKPIAAVAAARRQWLEEQRRRPTIAEFLRMVEQAEAATGYNPPGGRVLLPHPADPKTGELLPYSELTEPDQWSWHARQRIFREANGFTGPNPCDRNGKWLDPDLDRQARAELAERRRRDRPYSPGPKPPDDVVRPDWRSIRAPDLTEAERALAEAEVAQMRQEIVENLDRMAKRGRAVVGADPNPDEAKRQRSVMRALAEANELRMREELGLVRELSDEEVTERMRHD
jgi:hypothetical protein